MEVLRRCPLAIAQRLVHCTIALSTAVLDRVTKTMSIAQLLTNNLDNSKQKTSNLLSPAPPPYSWSLLGKSEGPAPPPSSKISWSHLEPCVYLQLRLHYLWYENCLKKNWCVKHGSIMQCLKAYATLCLAKFCLKNAITSTSDKWQSVQWSLQTKTFCIQLKTQTKNKWDRSRVTVQPSKSCPRYQGRWRVVEPICSCVQGIQAGGGWIDPCAPVSKGRWRVVGPICSCVQGIKAGGGWLDPSAPVSKVSRQVEGGWTNVPCQQPAIWRICSNL